MKLRNMFGIVLGVCVLAATPAFAQSFRQVSQSGFVATQVAAGGVKIFAPDAPSDLLYQYIPSYDAFANLNNNPLEAEYVGVGGGNTFQSDESWVEEYYGYLWHFNLTTQVWDLALIDNRVQNVVVGPGYADSCHPYEVWIVIHDTAAGWGPERYNYCTKVFDFIGTSLAPTGLSKISTGGGEVWALNTSNRIFRFNPVTGAFVQMTGALAQIAVGVDGVWGLNANGSFFEFNPISQVFNAVAGNKFTAIAAGGNGIWGLNAGLAYRYVPSTRTWVQVYGAQLSSISSGTGGGVFGVNASTGVVYAFD